MKARVIPGPSRDNVPLAPSLVLAPKASLMDRLSCDDPGDGGSVMLAVSVPDPSHDPSRAGFSVCAVKKTGTQTYGAKKEVICCATSHEDWPQG